MTVTAERRIPSPFLYSKDEVDNLNLYGKAV
jgi:hypothetical protein